MKKEILINGGLRNKQGDIILTIYSTPLSRLFIDKNINSLDIKYISNLFILKPGNARKITIERKKQNTPLLTTRVGKLIPRNLLSLLKSNNRQLPVKIILRDLVLEKELLKYNNLIKYVEVDDVDTNIPKSEQIKVACNISCFRNKTNLNYRFNVRHRIFEEIANRKYKVVLTRNKTDDFVIRKNPLGRRFNFYKNKKGHPLSYMQISPSLVTDQENKLFNSGRRSVSSKLYLSNKEFNLDISKFFMTKDERELAYALLKRNINVRLPEMRKREADIVLKESGIQIELTKLKPREKENSKNSPHTQGAHINARLCEGYLRVHKKKVPLYFVVFDKKWLNYKWVNDLILEVEPYVKCITTNFEYGWEEKAANKIQSILKERGFLK